MSKIQSLLRTVLEIIQDESVWIRTPKKNIVQIEFETAEQATNFYNKLILTAYPPESSPPSTS